MPRLLAIFLLVSPAQAHSWYDGECCSEQDCRQTVLGEVERRATGWYIVPLDTLVPFEDPRLRHSLDPLIHICLMPSGLRCLYVPEVAG